MALKKPVKILIGVGVAIGSLIAILPWLVVYTSFVFHVIAFPINRIDGANIDGISGSLVSGPRFELFEIKRKDNSYVKIENLNIEYEFNTDNKHLDVDKIIIDRLEVVDFIGPDKKDKPKQDSKKEVKEKKKKKKKKKKKTTDATVHIKTFRIKEMYLNYVHNEKKRKWKFDTFLVKNIHSDSKKRFEKVTIKSNYLKLEASSDQLLARQIEPWFHEDIDKEEQERILQTITMFILLDKKAH